MTEHSFELKRIWDEDRFEDLQSYCTDTTWKGLQRPDRDLLVSMVLKYGNRLLTQNRDREATDLFTRLKNLTSDNWNSSLIIGQLYLRHGNSKGRLAQAKDHLVYALKRNPSSTESISCATEAWLSLGVEDEDLEILHEAVDTWQQLLQSMEPSLQQPRALIRYGIARFWQKIGLFSQELCDYQQAIQVVNEGLQEAKETPCLWAVLGELLMAVADLLNRPDLREESCNALARALELDRADSRLWLAKARCHAKLYMSGQSGDHLVQAEQAFKSAAALDDTCEDLWIEWGELRLLEGRLSRDLGVIGTAVEKLQHALNLSPHSARTLISLARAQALLGSRIEDWELLRQSEQHLQQAQRIDPQHPSLKYTYALLLLHMGQYHEDARYLQQALAVLDSWSATPTQEGEYWYIRAWILSTLAILTHDPSLMDDANQGFSRAAEVSQGDTRPLYDEWGCCLLKLAEWTQESRYVQAAVAKFERAVVGFENAGDSGPPLEWLYDYGCALDFLGDYTDEPQHYEKAIQVLTHIVQHDPEFWPARYNLALAWAHLGELTAEVDCFYEAISGLEEITSHDAEDDHAWHELGVTLLDLALLTRDPGHPDRYESLMHQAESNLLQAAKLGHTPSLYSLAGLYSQLGAIDPAMHYLERARNAGTLPPASTLIHDDWLEQLRDTTAFQEFLLSLDP